MLSTVNTDSFGFENNQYYVSTFSMLFINSVPTVKTKKYMLPKMYI